MAELVGGIQGSASAIIHRWRLVGAGTPKSRHSACARVKSAMRALPAGSSAGREQHARSGPARQIRARHARSGPARQIRAGAPDPRRRRPARVLHEQSRATAAIPQQLAMVRHRPGHAPATHLGRERHSPPPKPPRALHTARAVPNPGCKCQIPDATQISPGHLRLIGHSAWRVVSATGSGGDVAGFRFHRASAGPDEGRAVGLGRRGVLAVGAPDRPAPAPQLQTAGERVGPVDD